MHRSNGHTKQTIDASKTKGKLGKESDLTVLYAFVSFSLVID